MASREYPRRGSGAALALMALHNTGGRSTASAWALLLDWKGNATHFKNNIIDRLRVCGLIVAAGELVEITPEGYRYLGINTAPIADAARPAAGPRYVAPMRPLNVARHCAAAPMREGALDYMTIPSRMGAESVSYKGAACFAGEVQ